MPSIRIVDYPWYDGCLRPLGGLLLERLQSWVDQSTPNKVNFLDVAAQRVTALVIEWNTAAKSITLIKLVAPRIEVVPTLIKVVALVEVASLVCPKDAFQETVPGLHLLPSTSI